MNSYFSREDTKVMKGIAILLMLMHHLWGFPDRIMGGGVLGIFKFMGVSLPYYIGLYGNICVSLFFFLGGYGIYINSKEKKINIIKKIKTLYICYGKVFLVFVPIAFAFFQNQPIYCQDEQICTRYANFSIAEFLNNLCGIQSTYNSEWWFLISYIYAIISFPLIKKIIDKFPDIINICLVLVVGILMQNVFPALGTLDILGGLSSNYIYKTFFCQVCPFISCFWMGCVCAKGNLLLRLKNSLADASLLNPILEIFILFFIVFLRNTGIGNGLDLIYVLFIIIFCIDLLERLNGVRRILLCFGKQSTNMWLIHSFFCYYFSAVVKIVVWPRYAIPSLVLLVILTYAASIGVTFLWKAVTNVYINVLENLKSKVYKL